MDSTIQTYLLQTYSLQDGQCAVLFTLGMQYSLYQLLWSFDLISLMHSDQFGGIRFHIIKDLISFTCSFRYPTAICLIISCLYFTERSLLTSTVNVWFATSTHQTLGKCQCSLSLLFKIKIYLLYLQLNELTDHAQKITKFLKNVKLLKLA